LFLPRPGSVYLRSHHGARGVFPHFHVQEIPGKIQHNTKKLSKCYPKGSIILSLDRIKYYIDHSDTLHPKLMVQLGSFAPQVYAEDIVDLQFTYTMKNGDVVDVPPSRKTSAPSVLW